MRNTFFGRTYLKKWYFYLILIPFFLSKIGMYTSSASPKQGFNRTADDGLYHLSLADLQGNMTPDYFPTPEENQTAPASFTDIYVPNEDFAFNYYSHLGDNIIVNRLGVCGYTGIAMLLSFYDVYWNDGFIEKEYESVRTSLTSTTFFDGNQHQSPAILRCMQNAPYMASLKTQAEMLAGGTGTNAYYEELDILVMSVVLGEIDSDTFAGKLFSIAIEEEKITPHFTLESYYLHDRSDYIVWHPNKYVTGLGVGNGLMNAVLSNYVNTTPELSGKVDIQTSKISVGSGDPLYESEKARIKSEIVSLVSSGKPVLVGGQKYNDLNNNGIQDIYPPLPDGSPNPNNENSAGHLVIAYDYDENSETLYGNFGWGSSYAHKNMDEYFNIELSDYWAFDIDESLPQSMTNKYIFTDENRLYSPLHDSRCTLEFAPVQYGFEDAYPTDQQTMQTFVAHTVDSGFEFETRRYRTGYIHNEYIVLSCMRRDISEAFIEYRFDDPIYGIVIDLAYWRDFAFDWLSAETAYAYLYMFGRQDLENQYDTGGWMPIADLLSDSIDMPRDRTNPKTYYFEFNQPIHYIKIKENSRLTNYNDNNRGRLCIGNLSFVTGRDTPYIR